MNQNRKFLAAAVASVAALALALACGHPAKNTDDTTQPPPGPSDSAPEKVQKDVGAQGGKVSTSDGTVLDIPAGALTGNVTISAAQTPDAPVPQGATPVATPYTFGPEGQQFAKPVTVTLAFDPAQLPPGKTGKDIVIVTAPAGSSKYVALATRLVDATHVAAETTHFSTFCPAMPTKCLVMCNMTAPSQDCSVGGGCQTVGNAGCSCRAWCKDDGSPGTQVSQCDGSAGGGSNCPPPPTDSHGFNIDCQGTATSSASSTCSCRKDGMAGKALPGTVDCADLDKLFDLYQTGCGYPGQYSPPPPPPQACGANGTCPAGQLCCSGKCLSVTSCGGSTDADAGQPDPGTCTTDKDCGPSGVCVSGRCQGSNRCMNVTCPAGQFCDPQSGACIVSGGADGGMGGCPPCGPGERCDPVAGTCVKFTCGSSTDCPTGYSCMNGSCVPPSQGCTSDAQCGGGKCDLNTGTCMASTGCKSDGDCGPSGKCDTATGKCTGSGCMPNCAGRMCGPDGCGGTCGGGCPSGMTCSAAGTCSPGGGCTSDIDCGTGGKCDLSTGKCTGGTCMPNCAGRMCGPDGCGGTCGGGCPSGMICSAAGTCMPGGGCTSDAQCGTGGKCDTATGKCTGGSCMPNCMGRTCGPDGCGGQCGICAAGQSCLGGTCQACTPNCAGRMCGGDGCGGQCGGCPMGSVCDSTGMCAQMPGCTSDAQCPGGRCDVATGRCTNTCVPNCAGKQCGPDGCGGQCGMCGAGMTCNGSSCIPSGGCVQDSDCPSGLKCLSGKCG